MINVVEKWPRLIEVVRKSHDECPEAEMKGHGFDHALQVAIVATRIAPDSGITALLASAAGLCHNADCILENNLGDTDSGSVTEEAIKKLVMSWLEAERKLTEDWREIVIDAVLEHSKANNPNDSLVTYTLKDADRVVNLGADVIIRGAQHQDVLPIDPWRLREDNRGSYRKRHSMVPVIEDCLIWVSDDPQFGIRLPKAREMAEGRARFLRRYLSTLVRQREDLGLVPYPLDER